MSGVRRTLVLSAELDHQISGIAKKLGLSHTGAARLLLQRALGLGTARLLVDEKTLEVKNLMAKRIRRLIDDGLRADLHALVDEVNPPSSESLVEGDIRAHAEQEAEPEEVEEETEVEGEPRVEPIKGRKRKAAKARRR